eukprot:10403517-Heterocapsa_arctica.AAC.1
MAKVMIGAGRLVPTSTVVLQGNKPYLVQYTDHKFGCRAFRRLSYLCTQSHNTWLTRINQSGSVLDPPTDLSL